MAALVITAANVIPGADAAMTSVTWGGTITQGMAVYKDVADAGKYKAARGNAAGTSHATGIALSAGANGQPGMIATSGDINLGATLAVGQVYCVSDAVAGEIVPYADLGTADYVVVLGIAETASNLILDINDPTVVKA